MHIIFIFAFWIIRCMLLYVAVFFSPSPQKIGLKNEKKEKKTRTMNVKERTNGMFALGVYSISIANVKNVKMHGKIERKKNHRKRTKNCELKTRMYIWIWNASLWFSSFEVWRFWVWSVIKLNVVFQKVERCPTELCSSFVGFLRKKKYHIQMFFFLKSEILSIFCVMHFVTEFIFLYIHEKSIRPSRHLALGFVQWNFQIWKKKWNIKKWNDTQIKFRLFRPNGYEYVYCLFSVESALCDVKIWLISPIQNCAVNNLYDEFYFWSNVICSTSISLSFFFWVEEKI